MNIITKIGIVMIALLGVCVSVVFSRQVLVVENYRQGMLVQTTKAEDAVAARDDANLVATTRNQEIARLKSDVASLDRQLRVEKEERADDVQGLKRDLAASNRRAETFGVNFGKNVDLLKEVQEERTVLRKQQAQAVAANRRLENERTSLGNNLADREATIERLNATVRLLKERVTQLSEQLAAAPGGGATAVVEIAAEEAPRISGTVTAVGDDLASINIGSVKGIKDRTVLYVYRDDHFIAHLRIIAVDDAESTGQIFDPRAGQTPQVGDKVTTSLR